MREGDKIQELWKEREYLSVQLEDATKELARLDLLNLTLTRQKRQAIAAFHFIRVMQEKIQRAFTIDDLYFNVVKALTSELFMDSAAVLRINFETKDISLLASAGLPENLKCLKLHRNIAKQQLLYPTFVNSKSSLQSFHKFIRKSFKYPYFIWYPMADEKGCTLVLFVGNRVEDLLSKQPFSEASLETFGAISSVILLRSENIAYTQEILRKKEERIDFLAEILRSSPVSVIATDENAKIVYCNPAVEELYGYKAEELIGRDPGVLNAEPNAAEIQSEIIDTVRQGNVWRGEILNRKKNGDQFYIRASICKVLDSKRDFIALVGFHEDITERRRAQEALKESENKYRTIFENTGTGTIIIEEDTTISLANKEFEKLTGYSKEEVQGKKSWKEFVMKDDLARLKGYHYDRRIDANGAPRNHELKFIDKHGNVRDVYLTVDVIPGTKKSVASSLDITERKRADEEMRKFKTILDNANYGVAITDLVGDIMYINKYFAAVHGYDPHKLVGKNLSVFHTAEQLKEVVEINKQLQESGSYNALEVWHKHRNGSVFPMLMNAITIRDEEGKPLFMAGTAIDITERKRAEERVREYEARYSHLLGHLPDGVALAQRRRIIRVNPRMVQMFSYPSPESMEGLSLLDLASPGSEEIVRQELTPRALGQQGENRFEFQGLRKDGSTFSAECTLTMDRSEAKSFLLAILRDVTARKTFEERRKLLSERIMTVQERERASVARELHDEMGQALTGIKMDMSWIKSHMKCTDEAVSARFEALGNLVDTTIKSVHELAASLHPSVLDRLGLTAAIEWYAGEFERRTGIECIIESESSDFNIDSNAVINVYRIFQEALTNVARHARASRVDIRIAHNRGYLTICISDNGKGIPSQKFSGPMSLGIAGMRERAQLVKGRLDIQSRRGKGTTVTLRLPVSL